MAQLSSFSGEQAERLIALPYKIGLWISFADDEAGEGDDKKELEALE